MDNILFTRQLSASQRGRLAKENINFSSLPFVQTESNVNNFFNLPTDNFPWVFTSVSAVKSVIRHPAYSQKYLQSKCYAVGEKTAIALQKAGYTNIKKGQKDAKALAEKIVKAKEEGVNFFCGAMRHHSLPDMLRKNKIYCNEIIVYSTTLNKKLKVPDNQYTHVVFMSPSAVEAFAASNKNQAKNLNALSIGQSTAEKAQAFNFKTLSIAQEPTFESILETILSKSDA